MAILQAVPMWWADSVKPCTWEAGLTCAPIRGAAGLDENEWSALAERVGVRLGIVLGDKSFPNRASRR
jgi:hypothetical protein